MIVAADHATFFDPHVTYGMTAAFEPMLMLGRMPFGEIMRLTLMGNHERVSAERAHQIGCRARRRSAPHGSSHSWEHHHE